MSSCTYPPMMRVIGLSPQLEWAYFFMTPAKKRVIVYIDGFNFYYGLKSSGWKKYYWLDIVKFFSSFMESHQELVQVNYFSAIPYNSGEQKRQDSFFSANKLDSTFKLHLGKFLKKTIICRSCNGSHDTYKEKESDVRVATRMISDVVNDKCDISILVSGDSDLIPPIEFIKDHKPTHKIFVYFPPKRESSSLRNLCDKYVKLERHSKRFEESMLDNELTDSTGYVIKRPGSWF